MIKEIGEYFLVLVQGTMPHRNLVRVSLSFGINTKSLKGGLVEVVEFAMWSHSLRQRRLNGSQTNGSGLNFWWFAHLTG